jgi:hypothetical protein
MKYRSDFSTKQDDGAIAWFSKWMGGPTLSKVQNCRLHLAGDMRRSVSVDGEADTYFSIPASCSIAGCRVKGYLTTDGDGYLFRPVYY